MAWNFSATDSPCSSDINKTPARLCLPQGRAGQLFKRVSQSLPPAGGKSNAIHFRPGRVPGRKFFSVCKCGTCSPLANKLCARQTASLLSKKGFALFGQSQPKAPGEKAGAFGHVQGAVTACSALKHFGGYDIINSVYTHFCREVSHRTPPGRTRKKNRREG